MILVRHKGSFNKLEKFLNRMTGKPYLNPINEVGAKGVEALKAATPVDSGKTAESWNFTMEAGKDSTLVSWNNSNVNDGVNVALLINYGHGLRQGGYVPPNEFIQPALEPVILDAVAGSWKEVTDA